MDVRMPEMTGLEAAAQLARELPGIIVILMTAFEAAGIWRASQESGAFAFVMKENQLLLARPTTGPHILVRLPRRLFPFQAAHLDD
jgi:CheY-like chemotaxis protein